MSPSVLWWGEKQRGSWSCVNMLNEVFDLYECQHVTEMPKDGVILVLHGGNAQLHGQGPAVAKAINHAVADLKWCIFVVIGDEGTEFCTEQLQHPNSRLWVQTPLPTTKAHRYLIEGYPAGTKNLNLDKDLEVFFMGQDTHDRRHACIEALRLCEPPSGFLKSGWVKTTDSFGSGLPHDQYIEWMNRAKIVPCPSGPASPDTFRIWEALECGAIPILDAQSLNPRTLGFWEVVLGGFPLPIVEDWQTLPNVIRGILEDYERLNRFTQFFWRQYKLNFRDWLAKDMLALGAK